MGIGAKRDDMNSSLRGLSRRDFIATSLMATAGSLTQLEAAESRSNSRRWRAAIVGRTGEGNYGHELDVLFNGVPNVDLRAVADPNTKGRARAALRSNAPRQYADYREMLRVEKPELVVIAPRWTTRHHEIAMAALECGAHVLTEKPFTTTLVEADEILAHAKRRDKKVAVAHQMRLAPSIVYLKRSLRDGLLGELQQIHAWGKQDSRAGGEDMMVLGTHLFDLIRLLAGDAIWCTARVLDKGHEISRGDARRVRDEIGPVAGDDVEAQFGFANGVVATFTSRTTLRQTLGPWGMELIGSKGVIRILTEVMPRVLSRNQKSDEPAGLSDEWQPLSGDPTVGYTAAQRSFVPANRRVLDDWLEAIMRDREPQCSGANAMKAIEMVMAVYEAALQRARVKLPLDRRTHPLS